jgi:hypothetical protein
VLDSLEAPDLLGRISCLHSSFLERPYWTSINLWRPPPLTPDHLFTGLNSHTPVQGGCSLYSTAMTRYVAKIRSSHT